jgi:hypothetical protein
MDNFVSRENIKRFRRLAGAATDAGERSRIMKLLAEEESKSSSEESRQGDAPAERSHINAATENPVENDGKKQRSGS